MSNRFIHGFEMHWLSESLRNRHHTVVVLFIRRWGCGQDLDVAFAGINLTPTRTSCSQNSTKPRYYHLHASQSGEDVYAGMRIFFPTHAFFLYYWYDNSMSWAALVLRAQLCDDVKACAQAPAHTVLRLRTHSHTQACIHAQHTEQLKAL